MLHSKQFVKKTKKGKVLKVVREHYLRDDIWSGSPWDPESDPACNKLAADAREYLVVDTNVVLQQIDFLEHAAVEDVIVMGVVLEEVRHRNASVYQRLRALTASPARRFYVFSNEHHRETYIKAEAGESPNDRNDRAIRVAAAWYAARLPKMRIVVLTNDADNRRRALEAGLQAMTVQAYARSRTDCAELADLVAAGAGAEGEEGVPWAAGAGGKPAKRKRVYEDHRPMSEVTAGLKAGRLHQGLLRVNRFNPYEGWVASEGVGADILVSGRTAMNRALEGDVVAVELLPEDQWRGPARRLPGPAEAAAAAAMDADGGDEGGADAAEAAAERDGGGAHLAPQVDPGEHYGDDAEDASDRRPTGAVVGIIRRNWRTRGYAGSLQPPREGQAPRRGAAAVLFCPVERRFPFIRIHTRQAEALADKRIVVAIDSWEADSAYPAGHYVRTLGPIGDRETETEVLLLENDINTAPFSQAVHGCVPPLPWAVTDEDIADPNREDLRDLVVCSVDPPGCKDIDDALHARPLAGGNLELGVHIADVTHFLEPGSAMDDEAAARATTTYLVQRRIDMLPKPLTEDICSLRAGGERLAFSVIWELTPDAQPVAVRFTKSVIRSRAALTYAEAQSRLDDARLGDEVSVSLRALARVARILRRRRADAGALQLASPEVRFEIDTETHDPLDVGMYQVREANQMVEEMMLLANTTVAEHVLRAFPTCALLRRHTTPPPRQFEPLLRAAAAAHVDIDISSSKALAASLDAAVRPGDPYFNTLLRILATRCMTQAAYFGSGDAAPAEYTHYGLAAPLYTHFTSPIRRHGPCLEPSFENHGQKGMTYADVVVHRLLAATLRLASVPDAAHERRELKALVDNLNARHRGAQMAGRASVELHTLIFFRGREVVADARITKVRANGVIVFVPKYGIEGPVYLTERPGALGAPAPAPAPARAAAAACAGAELVLDEEKQTVSSRDGAVRFTVFDMAAVRIMVAEAAGHRRQLVLELVDRALLPDSEKAAA